jgi:hypothetical protein
VTGKDGDAIVNGGGCEYLWVAPVSNAWVTGKDGDAIVNGKVNTV